MKCMTKRTLLWALAVLLLVTMGSAAFAQEITSKPVDLTGRLSPSDAGGAVQTGPADVEHVDGDVQDPAPEGAEGDVQDPAPEGAEGDVQDPAPEGANGDVQDPAREGANGDVQDPAPEGANGDVQDPAPEGGLSGHEDIETVSALQTTDALSKAPLHVTVTLTWPVDLGDYQLPKSVELFSNLYAYGSDSPSKIDPIKLVDPWTISVDCPPEIERFLLQTDLHDVVIEAFDNSKQTDFYGKVTEYVLNADERTLNIVVTNDWLRKVTYSGGEHGKFPDEVYAVPNGGETPRFAGDVANCDRGWTFVAWAPEWTGIVTQDVTYKALWQQNTYNFRIRYHYDDVLNEYVESVDILNIPYGTKIAFDADGGVTFGDIHAEPGRPTHQDKQYEYDSAASGPWNWEGVLDPEINVIDVYYRTPPTYYTLTIRYWLDEIGGTPAAETHTANLLKGAKYSVASPAVEGWEPSKGRVRGEMPGASITVDIVYEQSLYTLTINYLFSTGGIAAPAYERDDLKLGETYSVRSPQVAGYTPDRARVRGEMPGRNMKYTVIYLPDGSQVSLMDYGTPLGMGSLFFNMGDCFD